MSDVVNYRLHYDPCICTIEVIKQTLKGLGPKNAIRYDDTVIGWDGKKFKNIDVSKKDDAFFLDTSKRSNLEGKMETRFNLYQTHISTYHNWTIEILSPGDYFELHVAAGSKFMFCCSEKTPTYFDMVFYPKTGGVITYSQTIGAGIAHSGDKNSGNNLLQFVSNNGHNGKTIWGVTGYNRNPLHRWKDTIPTMYAIDEEKEVLYIIPLPLDKATIGESTFAGMVSSTCDGNGNFRCKVLEKPVLQLNVDTGYNGADLRAKLNRAFDLPVKALKAMPALGGGGAKDEPAPKMPAIKPPETSDVEGPLVLMQGTSKAKFPSSATVVEFGPNGYHHFTGNHTYDGIGIPAIFQITGPLAGVCGKKQSSIFVDFDETNYMPCIHVHDNWLDSTGDNVTMKMNGILFIHPIKPFTRAKSRDAIEEYMNDVCVNARYMMDQRSIVIIVINDEYYWYSGIGMEGFTEHIPNYGDNVTGYFGPETIDLFYKTNATYSWPRFVPKEDTSVFLGDEMMSPEEAVAKFLEGY